MYIPGNICYCKNKHLYIAALDPATPDIYTYIWNMYTSYICMYIIYIYIYLYIRNGSHTHRESTVLAVKTCTSWHGDRCFLSHSTDRGTYLALNSCICRIKCDRWSVRHHRSAPEPNLSVLIYLYIMRRGYIDDLSDIKNRGIYMSSSIHTSWRGDVDDLSGIKKWGNYLPWTSTTVHIDNEVGSMIGAIVQIEEPIMSALNY